MNDNDKAAMEWAIRELGSSPQYYEASTDDIFELGFEAGLECGRRWNAIATEDDLPKTKGYYFWKYPSDKGFLPRVAYFLPAEPVWHFDHFSAWKEL